MSGFSPEWLRQREPFDLAARDRTCMARFAMAIRQATHRPLRLLDLASGSGASFRALAPLIDAEQVWMLTDNDADLLSARSAHTGRWTTQHRVIDLARRLDELDFSAFDGITTSAFLDLVSRAWLARFTDKLTAARRPLLAMLSVDGRRLWHPSLPEDIAVLTAFERHQASDKGFGAALGATAAYRLADLLSARGWTVTLAHSDWHLSPDAVAMLNALLEDTLRAAYEACPEQADEFSHWGEVRQGQIARGELSLDVGHLDLLALPSRSVAIA